MLSRRILVNALLAAAVVASTGCCGRVRNFVYRVRHCPGCAVGFDGPGPAVGGPVGYDVAPVAAGPVGGCATCYSGGPGPADFSAPHVSPIGAAYPMVGGPMVGGPMVGGPVFTGPIPGVPAPTVVPQMEAPKVMPGEKKN